MGTLGAWLLLLFAIAATGAAFIFFIIVLGLSGGSARVAASVALCFALLVTEVTIGMRLISRRQRKGYSRH